MTESPYGPTRTIYWSQECIARTAEAIRKIDEAGKPTREALQKRLEERRDRIRELEGEIAELGKKVYAGQPELAAAEERRRKAAGELAEATADWWLEDRPFFGGLERQRIWTFWRRVLHTCHHRTQVQTWLRLAGAPLVPPIYGPSGDVSWDEADPTY